MKPYATALNSAKKIAFAVACILGVVTLFYLPAFWLLPDPNPHRWTVWMLGYCCGIGVMILSRKLP